MKKLLLFSCFLTAACSGMVNMNPEKIVIGDLGCQNCLKHISVSDTQSGPDALQRLTVTGETSTDVKLFYSVVWFDDDYMKINTTLSKPVMANIRKNQPFHWSAVAPSTKATSYKVYIANRAIEQ